MGGSPLRTALGILHGAPGADALRRFPFEHARAAGLPTLLVTHDEADAVAAAGAVMAFPEASRSAPPARTATVLPLSRTR